jgi:lysophospholipase L1-like esterase
MDCDAASLESGVRVITLTPNHTHREVTMKRLLLVLFLLLPAISFAKENAHGVWDKDIAAFQAEDKANPPPPGSVLFVGSSSIRFWKSLSEDFPFVHTINRGFGGSDLDDSVYFADRIVTPYKAKAIVVYAGDNDIMGGDTPEGVRDDFIAFVGKVRKAQPNVPIAFIAIKPSVARKSLMAPMHQANEMIKAWAASQKNVTFLDIWPDMLDKNGQPRPELFIQDGLHMDRQGYDIWVAKVTPWLKSLH